MNIIQLYRKTPIHYCKTSLFHVFGKKNDSLTKKIKEDIIKPQYDYSI